MKQESLPVRIAKASLSYLMEHGKVLPAFSEPVPAELKQPAGVFVSLKKQGQLRGCIGTILPTQSDAATEIIRNAVNAATADPRPPPTPLPAIPPTAAPATEPLGVFVPSSCTPRTDSMVPNCTVIARRASVREYAPLPSP